jgi:ketosteroid isomerase-like protein
VVAPVDKPRRSALTGKVPAATTVALCRDAGRAFSWRKTGMGAREVMDQIRAAFEQHDLDAVAKVYAADAVLVTPENEFHGREAITDFYRQQLAAVPDSTYELVEGHEAGSVAVDEGYWIGTNTGPLQTPTGETVPATGRSLRLRACDIVTIDGGMVISHRFYYDQLDMFEQLGLLPDTAS